MANEIAIPDYLKKIVESNQHSSAALITSAGSAAPRISLKGRQFHFIKDGEELAKTPGPIKVVILGVQPENGMAKTFYKDGYNPGDTSPPDCSSQDGIRPDAWVSTPISPNCASCANNKWGSATSLAGKKAKACKDSKRLIVTKASDPAEGVPYVLNVTVASLKALSEYGKHLVANKVPLSSVITQVNMVDSDFPQVEFEYVEVLAEDKMIAALERADKKEWESEDQQAALTDQSQGMTGASLPDQSKPTPASEPEQEEPQKVTANADNILDDWG